MTVGIEMVGADLASKGQAVGALPGTVNYLTGADRSHWRVGIPTFDTVRYHDVYPGVDAAFHGNQTQFEYAFTVAPRVDPAIMRLRFPGTSGLRLVAGELVVAAPGGELRQRAPHMYQQVDGKRRTVTGAFVISGDQVGFSVGSYDHTKPLVIDPTIVYSTFLGGSGSDAGQGVAVDGAGNAYVTGRTDSPNFPTTPGAFKTSGPVSGDAFVSKFNPSGSALLYSTFIGGSDYDIANAIAVDGAGNAYITGQTNSADFPTTPGAFQPAQRGAFVTKLNPTGSDLVYSTYLGGTTCNIPDYGRGIAVDGTGAAYVAGVSGCSDFPTTPGAFQTSYGGGWEDAFVTKFKPDGTGLIYSTYLGGQDPNGGDGRDEAHAIAIDHAGAAYVTGFTASVNFPTTPGAFQPSYAGNLDAFVTKLAPSGGALAYSTFLGGAGEDFGEGVAVDAAGAAYVTGSTGSLDFPTTPNAIKRNLQAGNLVGLPGEAFVTKLNPAGLAPAYSTELGGNASDEAHAIAVDALGSAHITGNTSSTDFPGVRVAKGTSVGFVSRLSPDGSGVFSSQRLGQVAGNSIAVDPAANDYVTGSTASADFSTTPGAFQRTAPGGGSDAFVTKIANRDLLAVFVGDSVDPLLAHHPQTYTLTVVNAGTEHATGVVLTDRLPSEATFGSAHPGQGSCTRERGTLTCNLGAVLPGATATVTLTVTPTTGGTMTNTATVKASQKDPYLADNTGSARTLVSGEGCGQVITHSMRLTADIGPCAGDGVIIGADNVNLNLNGHKIFGFPGPGDGNAAGIRLPNRTGVTIHGGTVSNFDGGIFLNMGRSNVIEKMEVVGNAGPTNAFFGTSGPNLGDGIVLFHSSANIIAHNHVAHNGMYDGIGILGTQSDDNQVYQNVIDHQDVLYHPGSNNALGGVGLIINAFLDANDPLRGSSNHGNNIVGNTIRGNAGSGISNLSNTDALIQKNTILDNGYSSVPNNGIGVQNLQQATPVTNDTIDRDAVHGNGGAGIFINSQSNTITDNNAAGNGKAPNYSQNNPFDLDDENPGSTCDSNVWSGNIWGSGGFFPICVTNGGHGPPAAATAARARTTRRGAIDPTAPKYMRQFTGFPKQDMWHFKPVP